MAETIALELPTMPTVFHESNLLPEHLCTNWRKTKGCLAESNLVAEIATVISNLLFWGFYSFAGYA